MNKKNISSGLTLMELILALAIIAIVVAIATPNMAQFSSIFNLRGATQEITADLQYARLLAVKENRDFQVVFQSNSYQVVRVSDGSVVKNRSLNTEYPNMSLTNISVAFDSRGNSGAHTVTVSNSTGSKNISIAPTGRVKVQ